jgi:hypothetical protein
MATSVNSIDPLRKLVTPLKRLGWTGFWLQVVLGAVPLVLFAFGQLFAGQSILTLTGILSLISLAALLFTIYWSFQYVRIGNAIKNPRRNTTQMGVARSLWVGLTVNVVVMVLALSIGMITLGRLIGLMLTLPQGAAVVQTVPGSANAARLAVTSMDLFNLQAVINAIAAGLVGLIISLILLRRLP